MQDAELIDRMRADWNERAREDAHYYVAFGRRGQADEEFFASAADVVRALESDLPRLRSRAAALEIGCGPGRLMRPLARHFGEIYGVDVSDRMVRLAAAKLRDVPNAHPRHAPGSDLSGFPDESFDFVYSYAVFQHIPSRDVVWGYLREARRVLRPGGVLRCQINGLPEQARRYTTWEGVRIPAPDVAAFARDHDFQLLALEGVDTQYLWTTWRKQPAGWRAALRARPPAAAARLRSISNATTGEPVAPAEGPQAVISLWVEALPAACDLIDLEVRIDGRPGGLAYLGEPQWDGVSQLNVVLPPGTRTGLVPVEIGWLGRELAAPGWVRVVPPGPLVPRVLMVRDGIDLLSGTRIVSRSIKVSVEELVRPEQFRAAVDDLPIEELDFFCTDPAARCWEINLALPPQVGPGPHTLHLGLGTRRFAPVALEVA
jgi:SAM-dependent methyltransferase